VRFDAATAGAVRDGRQSTWPTATAAMAEKWVIPSAVSGFCPWATASWEVSSPRDWGSGVGITALEIAAQDRREIGRSGPARPLSSLPAVGFR